MSPALMGAIVSFLVFWWGGFSVVVVVCLRYRKKVVWKRGGEVEVRAGLLIIYHAITVTVETTSMADLRQLHHLPEQFQM